MAESGRNEKLLNMHHLDYSHDEASEDAGDRLMHSGYSIDKMGDVAFDDSMDVVVFMRDRSGIHVTLEEGHAAEADDLFDIVTQELNLPHEYQDVFSLWLVSPLLELRLKKQHKPFFLVQQWDELCSKYTDAKATDITKDEPVLMMQRNVFYPKEQEININNEQVLNLLYHEAKFNVIEGRYIMTPEEYHTLAGIQALIHLGKYKPRDHVLPSYRASIHQFYPDHMHTKKSSVFSCGFLKRNQEPKVVLEERMLEKHRQISQEYDHVDIDKNLSELYRKYLEICWPYPFYGSAFFDSEINKPPGKLHFLKKPQNIETWMAINTDGISVIDRDSDEVILSVPYNQLSWEFVEPVWDVDDDPLPCLYLQFLVNEADTDGHDRRVTKLLKVYSRQAKLMDALIDSCVKRKLQKRQILPHMDYVDSGQGVEFCSRTQNKLQKMCLTTFSTAGDILD